MAGLLPLFRARRCRWKQPAQAAASSQRNLLGLQLAPNANGLQSNCCAFQSAPSLRTKLTQPHLTGWDLRRCCCGRIHECRRRRSFQPGHLSWFLSWPGVISGTAGEGKDKAKEEEEARRRIWNRMETVPSGPCDTEWCCHPPHAE